MYKELNDTKQDSDDQTFYSCTAYDPSLFYSFCTKSQLEPAFLERIEMLRLSTNCWLCPSDEHLLFAKALPGLLS